MDRTTTGPPNASRSHLVCHRIGYDNFAPTVRFYFIFVKHQCFWGRKWSRGATKNVACENGRNKERCVAPFSSWGAGNLMCEIIIEQQSLLHVGPEGRRGVGSHYLQRSGECPLPGSRRCWANAALRPRSSTGGCHTHRQVGP